MAEMENNFNVENDFPDILPQHYGKEFEDGITRLDAKNLNSLREGIRYNNNRIYTLHQELINSQKTVKEEINSFQEMLNSMGAPTSRITEIGNPVTIHDIYPLQTNLILKFRSKTSTDNWQDIQNLDADHCVKLVSGDTTETFTGNELETLVDNIRYYNSTLYICTGDQYNLKIDLGFELRVEYDSMVESQVGRATQNGSEVFNHYGTYLYEKDDETLLLTPNSTQGNLATAKGCSTKAGINAIKIAGYGTVDDGEKSYLYTDTNEYSVLKFLLVPYIEKYSPFSIGLKLDSIYTLVGPDSPIYVELHHNADEGLFYFELPNSIIEKLSIAEDDLNEYISKNTCYLWLKDYPNVGTLPINADFSSAEGFKTITLALAAHSEGWESIARGNYSHVEGYNSVAGGESSHAEGRNTYTIGYYSHAEGDCTITHGEGSHAEGRNSIASCLGFKILSTTTSTILLDDGTSKEDCLVLELEGNASELSQFKEGNQVSFNWNNNFDLCCNILKILECNTEYTKVAIDNTPIDFDADKSESGWIWVPSNPKVGNIHMGVASHAEGLNTKAVLNASHAEGKDTIAAGHYAHAEGERTIAVYGAHAEGFNAQALAPVSHAEGRSTVTRGYTAHAEGFGSEADGDCSHAEGDGTRSVGKGAHSEGCNSEAFGIASHAEGYNCKAHTQYSHAAGCYSEATVEAQYAVGKCTKRNDAAVLIVGNGNGTEDRDRKNAFEVYWDGHAEVQTMGKTNNSVATKQYVDSASSKTKVVEFSNNETITVEDNTEYIAVEEITNITLIYPDTRFICSLNFTTASEDPITITLPDSKYIGGAPTFGNGETWELNIKNRVVVGGLIE